MFLVPSSLAGYRESYYNLTSSSSRLRFLIKIYNYIRVFRYALAHPGQKCHKNVIKNRYFCTHTHTHTNWKKKMKHARDALLIDIGLYKKIRTHTSADYRMRGWGVSRGVYEWKKNSRPVSGAQSVRPTCDVPCPS